MYRQMEISDFLDGLPECGKQQEYPHHPQTQFEQLFEKIKDPVLECANCLCQYCVNNVEGLDKINPGEMQEPCFACDECRIFSGDHSLRNQRKEECMNFVMSGYGAQRNRKRFKIIKGFGGGACGKDTADSIQHGNDQGGTGRQKDGYTESRKV